jgi:hypothetical protein
MKVYSIVPVPAFPRDHFAHGLEHDREVVPDERPYGPGRGRANRTVASSSESDCVALLTPRAMSTTERLFATV